MGDLIEGGLWTGIAATCAWLAYTDARYGILPDIGTGAVAISALALGAVHGGADGASAAACGGIAAFLFFLVARVVLRPLTPGRRDPLGLGDVKLSFGLGAIVGLGEIGIWFMILAAVGTVWILAQAAMQRRSLLRVRASFGPSLIFSAMAVLCLSSAGR